jgi:M3 family oligoendopeptidase
MTFTEYEYRRPNLKRLTKGFEKYVAEFDNAPTPEQAAEALKHINRLRRSFMTAYNIGHIRHTINTTDAKYDAENTFFDENSPAFEALESHFYQKLVVHRFRKDLEKIFGAQLFIIAELKIKTFEPLILTGMQEENKLSSEYAKLKATAKIEYEGKVYNLSSFHTFEIDPDRAIRKKAATKKWAFFAENAPTVEKIYDDAVKTRHKIATDLGYKNFVELGYMRMLRSDYDAKMVANFRKQVHEYIVPLCTALYERQRKRLNISELNYYDEDFRFPTGNPKPKGTPEDILRGADTMYRELSKDTDRFFQFMRTNNLMDLEARDNKATGGYCTFINSHRAPYIFSNFNGTSGDIDVLTHEAGHAFQVFSSRNKLITEYNWPTYEACEIHSMSMEFFTWPWMRLFFGEDADKYYFSHMSSALQFLPYGVAVDEFQHFVYENPTATPSVRNQKWRDLEK